MAGKIFQIYTVQINGKCVRELFLPLAWSDPYNPCKAIPCKFAQKSLFPISKVPPWGGRRYYALSSYICPFLKVSSLTFVLQAMAFQAKLPNHCVLKSYSTVIKFFKLFWSWTSKSYNQKLLSWCSICHSSLAMLQTCFLHFVLK